MSKILRVLIVEDSEDDALLIGRLIEKGGYELIWKRVETAEAMTQALATDEWDAIVSDYAMPFFGGLAALKTLERSGLDLPFIMVSGRMGEETAVEAMRAGAHDYLMKDRLKRLVPALEREIREAGVRLRRHRTEWKLRTQERFLRQIIDASPTYIYTRDRFGRFTMVNRATAEFFGVPAEDMVGRHLSELAADDATVERGLSEDREVLAAGEPRVIGEARVRAPGSSEQRWHQITKLPIVPPGERDIQVLGVSVDITDRKLAEERQQHDALHDALTGLPNRILFMERVEFALAHHRRAREYEFAVLFVDVQYPRAANETLGLPVGDELLAALADRLRQVVRTNDTISCFGSDKFAILLDGIEDAAAAVRAVERIRTQLALPLLVGQQEVTTVAAIGIALGSTGYDQAEHLLRDAGTAMYRAKTSSISHELFDRHLQEQVGVQMRLEAELRRSLDEGDFEMHYQPIVTLRDGRMVGLEALVRWRRPQAGLMVPDEFLPTAERTGLILPLGTWTLQESCEQISRWNRQYPGSKGLWVSVNLSSAQFARGDLIEEVDRILRETGTDAHWLRLEITETTAMQPAEQTVETLSRLRDRGIHVMVDDFGTGCSSLNRLNRLPFNTLKIDRSFIRDVRTDDRTLGIVRTIILLAHGLGMNVSAEGVETQQQKETLEELGCELAQGFLFSQALPAADAAQLIAAQIAT
jgi:diguanylate cyclase (GGDEF)-like protein/PAS domain S-box-containing protein